MNTRKKDSFTFPFIYFFKKFEMYGYFRELGLRIPPLLEK